MQRVARVCQRQLSYLLDTAACYGNCPARMPASETRLVRRKKIEFCDYNCGSRLISRRQRWIADRSGPLISSQRISRIQPSSCLQDPLPSSTDIDYDQQSISDDRWTDSRAIGGGARVERTLSNFQLRFVSAST